MIPIEPAKEVKNVLPFFVFKLLKLKDKEVIREVNVLNKLKESLEKNIPVRQLEFNDDELKLVKSFNLLTIKPIIYMTNVSEEDLISDDNEYVKMVREYAAKEKSEVVVVSAKIESELVDLTDEERTEFLNDLGIKENGLDKLIKATYKLGYCYLNRIGFNKDKEKAFQLFKIAAEKDYAPAMLDLATCYKKRIGTKKNLKEALKWYQLYLDKTEKTNIEEIEKVEKIVKKLKRKVK